MAVAALITTFESAAAEATTTTTRAVAALFLASQNKRIYESLNMFYDVTNSKTTISVMLVFLNL